MKPHPLAGRSPRTFALPAATLAALLLTTGAHAQTLWNGADPVNGNSWNNAANWSPATLPNSGTATEINNGGWARLDAGNGVARAFIVGNTTTGNRLTVGAYTLTTRAGTLGSGAGSTGSVTIQNGGTWRTDGSGTGYSAFYVGLGGSGTLVIDNGGTLLTGETSRIASSAGSSGSATVRGVWTTTHNLNVGLGGNGSLHLGAGGVVTTGTLLLGSGGAVDGVLTFGGASIAEAAGTLNAASIHGGRSATLNFNHTGARYRLATDSDHGNAALLVSGSARINQLAGTTVLEAANTYSEGTFITGGTLLANNTGATSATGSGAVSVSSGGTLGGTGRIAGATTVAGTLTPGEAGSGILTFASSLTLEETATLQISVGGEARGTDFTALDVDGMLTLGGTLSLVLEEGFNLAPGGEASFHLLDAGSLSATFTLFDLPTFWEGNALEWDTSTLHLNGTLRVAAVPEPGSLALAGLAALAALRLRRKL